MNDISRIIRLFIYRYKIKTVNIQYRETFHISHRCNGDFFAIYYNQYMAYNFRDTNDLKYWSAKGIFNHIMSKYVRLTLPKNY